jgi:hypothetical protein
VQSAGVGNPLSANLGIDARELARGGGESTAITNVPGGSFVRRERPGLPWDGGGDAGLCVALGSLSGFPSGFGRYGWTLFERERLAAVRITDLRWGNPPLGGKAAPPQHRCPSSRLRPSGSNRICKHWPTSGPIMKRGPVRAGRSLWFPKSTNARDLGHPRFEVE